MKRSIGVTLIAALSLLGSCLAILAGLLMAVVCLIVPMPDNTPAAPSPAIMKLIMLLGSLFYVLPGIWGIVTSVGLFRLKNWARISIIVFAVILVLTSGFGGLISLFMPPLPGANQAGEVAVWIMRLFSFVLVSIGIWWIVFFTRSKVKSQFVTVEANQLAAQASGVSSSTELISKRPLSITIIAWLLLAGSAFMPISLALHAPIILFTKLLVGSQATLCLLIFTAINLSIGIGLLRLRPLARTGAIGYFLFAALNMGIFYLAPGASGRIIQLTESQKTIFPWMPSPQNQPNYSFDPKPFLILGIATGVLMTAAVLYFLIKSKPAFDSAATPPPIVA
jgi:hypothetical protein